MIAEVLEAHALGHKLTKEGVTVWDCRAPGCGYEIPAGQERLAFAQAAHQAPLVLEMLRGV